MHCRIDIEQAIIKAALKAGTTKNIKPFGTNSLLVNKKDFPIKGQTFKIAEDKSKDLNKRFGDKLSNINQVKDGHEIIIAPSEALIDDYWNGYIKSEGYKEQQSSGIDRFGDSKPVYSETISKPSKIDELFPVDDVTSNYEIINLIKEKGALHEKELVEIFSPYIDETAPVEFTDKLSEKRANGELSYNKGGTTSIKIRNTASGKTAIYLHELTHEVTLRQIDQFYKDKSKLNKEQIEAIENLDRVYVHSKNELKNDNSYGFKNLAEFISEAFSNKIFQNKLNDIDYKNSSVFSKILNYLGQLLGVKQGTALSETLNETIRLAENTTNVQELGDTNNTIFNEEVKQELTELEKLTGKVKLFLQKKLAILEKKQIFNKKIKERELKKIISNIEALDGVHTINTFVEEAYNNIKLAESQFDNLIKNKDELSRHEMIEKLSAFNDFASGYSILNEISESDIEEYFSKAEKGLKDQSSFTTQDKLSYALMAKDKIKQRYLKQGIPLLADYLLESKSEKLTESVLKEIEALEARFIKINNSTTLIPKAKIKRLKEVQDRIDLLKGYDLDKASLIKQLQVASSDEGAIDYLFSPLISSEDSVLALFAKSIKNQLETARLKDIKFAEDAQKEYNKFLTNNSKSKDDVEKFNSDIYEEIDIPVGKNEKGETIYKTYKSFVQKYNVSKYEKSKNDLFKNLGPKPILSEKPSEEELEELNNWKKSVGIWFSKNTQAKSDAEIKEITFDKRAELKSGIITEEEYNDWMNSRIVQFYNKESKQMETSFRFELSEPANHYINKKWNNLYSEDGIPANSAGEYHAFLLNSYLEAQKKLPENFRRGYRLPSIPKDNIERIQTQGLLETSKKNLKEAVSIQSYDTEFGLAGLGEQDVKFLPVFYTQAMNSEDVSTDLISSILKFNSMVNRYESLNNINGEIALTKAVVDKRETISTNSKGQKIMDAFAKKYGYDEYIKKNGESYSAKHLSTFIDMIVYGEMQKSEELFGVDAGKFTNTLTGFSAVTTLAVDLLKATANNIQGNIQVMIEANSGEHFNKTNVKNGKAYYYKSINNILSDFGKISPNTLPSRLIELYDAIQGEYKDGYGKNISGSIARKLFNTSTLFFNQNIAEHEIQVSALFAMLDANTVLDAETNKSISLLEAYKKYGIDNIIAKTDFTEAKRKDVMNTHHGVAKRLHGVYNDFDKGTAQRYTLGRLAMMYRKYLIPSYKRRFKKLSGDQEINTITEGYYITFWNTFVRDLRDMQFNVAKNWSGYSTFEKAQIKRTTAEAVFIISLTALVMVLKAAGDDDEDLKKNYLYNFVLYQATRQRSETSAYISPIDAYRVVKSPSAMTGTLDRTIKFTNQILPWNITEEYKKKTGVWDKGDNKAWAYFLKLMGYSGYNITPEEAVKSFEGTLSK